MAFPFGGHPKLSGFIEFAQAQGCKIKVYARTSRTGRVHQILHMENPNGGWVVVSDPDFDEHLAPSTVTYYQRRLGIRTPFAAMPEQSSE
jgi:hypothetical protein